MGKKKEKNIKVTQEQFSWHLDRLRPMFMKSVKSLGFNLVLAEFVKESGFNYLRITISHEDRIITLDDCEVVSRAVNEKLDEDNKIDFPYILEIQSPGTDIQQERLDSSENRRYEFSVKGFDLVVNS